LVFDIGGFIYINPEMFRQALAQDIDPAQTKVMAAAQKQLNRQDPLSVELCQKDLLILIHV
jgi:hypothetical protein